MWCNSGRDFDGDVVDIITGQKCACAFQAASCFALAEDGFTKQVDVEANAWLTELGNSSTEFGVGCVHDEVPNHVAQYLARDRNNHSWHQGCKCATEAHCGPHVPGEEARDLGGKFTEVVCCDLEIFGANNAIDEAHGEGQSGGIFQYSRQHDSAGINRESLCFREPFAHKRDGIIGQFRRVCVCGHVYSLVGKRL